MQPFREIWWVRHAESLGNAGVRTPLPGTFALSERGAAQAAELARWFGRRPGLIVTSPYTRARQTAAPVIARHEGCAVDEWPVQEITYLAPARCADTTEAERAPMAREFWERNDPHYEDGAGAESFSGFVARIDDALHRARNSAAPLIAIFTHGHFIRGVIWRALHPTLPVDADTMSMFHHFTLALLVPNCAILPMLFADTGTTFLGPLHSPVGEIRDDATLDHLRLSGL